METTFKLEKENKTLPELMRNSIFVIGSILFWILIIFRNFNIVNLPHQIILIYSMFFLLTMDEKQQKAFMLSSITFRNAFQTSYFILFYLIVYVFKHYKELKLNSMFVTIILMLTWELFHLFYSGSSVNEYFRFLTFYVLLAVITMVDDYHNDMDYVIRVMSIYMICASMVLLFNTYHFYGSDIVSAYSNGYRLGYGFRNLPPMYIYMNANSAGTICNLVIMGLLVAVKDKKIYDYLLIIALIFTGTLTISRTFIIVLLAILILYTLLVDMKFSKKILTILLMFVLLGITYALISKYIPSVIDNFMERFNRTGSSKFGNRDIVFTEYNQFILDNPKVLLFGIGTQNILEKVDPSYFSIEFNVPHNGIQEVLVCWGVVGLFLILSLFVLMISSAIKQNKGFTILNLIPLVVFLIDIQAGQFITSNGSMLMLLIAYLLLFVPTNIQEKKNEEKF